MVKTFPELDPAAVRALLAGDAECALVDVREEGAFSDGHLYHAACIPLSRLERDITRLVPLRTTPIVLTDADGSLVLRAAEVLTELEYLEVSILAGGLAAWRAAGQEVFTGVNVPSKAFGEYIEHHHGTPSLSADELKARIDRGERLVILDSRPLPEYQSMSIPGAVDCPGAELVYRVHAAAPDPDTTVIVNCAGRTRSIIGAQSLVNAGIPNPVLALRNGTMGWHLAGHALEHGRTDMAAAPTGTALERAREAARRVARRFDVQTISASDFARWQTEAHVRTLYCLDVRDPSEYRAGHLPGFRNAPGGQLVQATDEYMATRNARVVLVDTDDVRAIMTGSWLNQMGLPHVRVLAGVDPARFTDQSDPELHNGAAPRADVVSVAGLAAGLARGDLVVVDFATSEEYRRGHVPGAAWAVRSRIGSSLAGFAPSGRSIVFTSPDAVIARWAARDFELRHGRRALVLDGGTEMWRAAGQPLVTGRERMLDIEDDVWRKPFDVREPAPDAMRAYLAWELELPAQLLREGVVFPAFPAQAIE